jgi:hypothetical protein
VTGISGTTFNIELTTSAPPVCDKKFFFGEGQDCVAGQPATMNAAYQTFQQGIMVWRSDTRQVYALYSSGNGVVMTEAWDGTTPITYSEQPPSGLLLPQNGFGWVWTSDSTVRATLGWGTAAEQGYSGQFQNGEVPNSGTPAQKVVYFSLPDGRNVRFVDRGAQSTWNYVS